MSNVCFEEGVCIGCDFCFVVFFGFFFVIEFVVGDLMVCVVVFEDVEFVCFLQDGFFQQNLCFYILFDVVGVEFGGIVKNIVVIVVGLVDGFGFGYNIFVVFMMCGLYEVICLGFVYGGWLCIFLGFVGMGDFVFICMGFFLCNWQIGVGFVQGKLFEQISGELLMVVEGVKNFVMFLKFVVVCCVEMLIMQNMVEVFYEGKLLCVVVEELMWWDFKFELEF